MGMMTTMRKMSLFLLIPTLPILPQSKKTRTTRQLQQPPAGKDTTLFSVVEVMAFGT